MDYYYDYDEAEDLESYEYDRYSDILEESPWMDVVPICIQPSLAQTTSYIIALLSGNIACRILWYAVKSWQFGSWLNHVCSVICGFSILYFSSGYDFLIVLFLCLVAYILILIVDYSRYNCMGIIVTIATISSLFIYETLWNHPNAWQRIRGIQMVATMKVISLAFDLGNFNINGEVTKINNNSIKSIPALIPYLGYIFCPATCVMGPWVPYNCYLRSIQKVRPGYRWILWTITNTLCAVIFLCMSNCIVPLLCRDNHWKWLVTFRDALSVRCSHYFISFVSQAMLAAAGVHLQMTEEHPLFGYMVTKPWNIEFPRSLSFLVRFWNIPMHDFLKHYVFRVLLNRYNSYALALICTYAVSSLLHGLHIKIYLILLSMSVFAYAESVLRLKLANVFSACISANPCRKPCKYIHCTSHGSSRWSSRIIVWSINLIFSLFTVLHLAYLGIILSNSDATSSENIANAWFELKNELGKWAALGYMSHWIAMLTYLFYYII